MSWWCHCEGAAWTTHMYKCCKFFSPVSDFEQHFQMPRKHSSWCLTHWGRVTHIYVSKLIIIVSDNGLSPGRCKAFIWTNDAMLCCLIYLKKQWVIAILSLLKAETAQLVEALPHRVKGPVYLIPWFLMSWLLSSPGYKEPWNLVRSWHIHYNDVIMTMIASQITGITIVYSTVYSCADQSKHQSSASLAFVRVIHRGPVNFPHKWPVTRKMLPFGDVIMLSQVSASRTIISLVNIYEIPKQFLHCPILLTWITKVIIRCGWNYLSIPKFQRCNHWSLGWINKFIPHFTGHVITRPCWD